MFCPELHRSLVQFVTMQKTPRWILQPGNLQALEPTTRSTSCSFWLTRACIVWMQSLWVFVSAEIPTNQRIKAKEKMIQRSEKPKKLRSLWCLFALHPPPGEEKPLYAAAFCQVHSRGTSHFESFCMLFFFVTFVSSFFSRSDARPRLLMRGLGPCTASRSTGHGTWRIPSWMQKTQWQSQRIKFLEERPASRIANFTKYQHDWHRPEWNENFGLILYSKHLDSTDTLNTAQSVSFRLSLF